jgi:hypothetical protein
LVVCPILLAIIPNFAPFFKTAFRINWDRII